MSDRYILDGTQPMPCADLLTWVRWMETADRHVAQIAVAPAVTVRTLFLGLDHNVTGHGCPMLFQTMIFGGPLGGVWERYRTWSEAAQGHAAMCARVQAALGVAGRHPCPSGHLCEVCLDAPAVAFVPAPWGGEMGVCAPCGGLEPAVPSEASGAVSDCPLCTQPPGPDEDAHVYLQHCADTGHPVRGRGSWRGNAPLIMRPGVSLRFFER